MLLKNGICTTEKSKMYASRTSSQTANIASGNPIIFNQADITKGNKISLNTTTGVFTLQAGSYTAMASAGHSSSSNGAIGYNFQTSTDGTTWSSGGCAGFNISPANAWGDVQGPTVAKMPIIAATVTYLRVAINYNSNVSAVGGGSGMGAYSYPWVEIEEA